MNLKPFDLEKALRGDPVVTRKGDKVSELHFFKTLCAADYPCVHYVTKASEGIFFSCYKKGNRFIDESKSDRDLFMAPKTKTLYLQVSTEADEEDLHLTTNARSDKKYFTYTKDYQIIKIEIEIED